ncbi:hypothetical protein [Microvirga zambiensis]|uniref:hypothetical protein n=1 Tax=Microvirga zambiensis TaxID=1402137 RepID=UPI00191CEE62|nr:hypothetical protein [Microvirga zambiensis]
MAGVDAVPKLGLRGFERPIPSTGGMTTASAYRRGVDPDDARAIATTTMIEGALHV